MKLQVLLYLLIVLGSIPSSTIAAQFTEILYDAVGTDTGYEWVEVHNETPNPISLVNWKLVESSINHGITSARGDGTLSSGEFAIIADNAQKFIDTWPSYGGDVFDSVFSLNNDGETLQLKNQSGLVESTAVYTGSAGAAGNGLTIHWRSGAWTSGHPNPGKSPSDAQTASAGNLNQSGTSTQNNNEQFGVEDPAPKFTVGFTGDIAFDPVTIIARSVFRVVPRIIKTTANGEKLDVSNSGIHQVSFGDGSVVLFQKSAKIQHNYVRPGQYVLVYRYYRNSLLGEPDISIERTVSVVSPSIRAGVEDGWVTLNNTTESILDISGWRVASGNSVMTIPSPTKVSPSMIIAVSQFSGYPVFVTTNENVVVSRIEAPAFPSTRNVSDYTQVSKNSSVTFMNLDKEQEMLVGGGDSSTDSNPVSSSVNTHQAAVIAAPIARELSQNQSVLFLVGIIVFLSLTAVIIKSVLYKRGSGVLTVKTKEVGSSKLVETNQEYRIIDETN